MENNISKHNILLDRLPDEYKGYLIRSDFRTGLLINRCLMDRSFKSEEEKIYTAARILFGKGVPNDLETALNGINWFLSGGKKLKNQKSSKQLISFEQDDGMIFSAFMTKFGIDLCNVKMHFFKFLNLMCELKKTTLSDIANLRGISGKELKRYSTDERRKILQMQSEYSIDGPTLSDDEKEAIRKFDERFLNVK